MVWICSVTPVPASQILPTVPQTQMFTNLMIFKAIVKIISGILIALGMWAELVGRQQD